ncbi:hypothetical protein [Cetobacterium sp.]|uniref:hypothetical protein n=1 Tax=Cetobacterium sp. TaxID=2071632 RepID=UPI003AA4A241
MIKVSKKSNKNIMEIFHRKIILLLFKWFQKSSKTVNSITSFDKDKNFTLEEIRILKLIFRKKKLKDHLNKILIFFIEKENFRNQELKRLKKIYFYQRKQLKKGNYNLKVIKIEPIISELFSEYFFKYLFEKKEFWNDFISTEFSKGIFKKNFKIQVCPYCNTEGMFQVENYKIDHFLPKSLFPLLSMYYLNLIPICESCNSFHSGKGNNIIKPIQSQFYQEIGTNIEFYLDLKNNSVHLKSNIEETKNFIDLLKLKNKYEIDIIFKNLKSDLKSFGIELSKGVPERYEEFYSRQIKSFEGRSLYYAKKYLFKDYINKKNLK